MYTKPIVYKVYSFIIALYAVAGAGGLIISFINKASAIFSPFEFTSVVHLIAFIVCLCATCWFGILEFTSMYTFADMVAHELKDDGTVFKRKLAFPGKVYRLSGSLVFYVVLMVDIVAMIVLTITYSSEHDAFLAIPVVPLLIFAVVTFFVHVVFNARYGAFGAVLDIKEDSDPKIPEQNRLKESNPNILRAFCGILFIFAILSFVAVIVILIGFLEDFMKATEIESKALAIILLIVGGLIDIFEMAIMGCFFDNLAKMQEHYLIKYKLI